MFQMGVDAFQLNHRGGKGVLPKLLCNRNLLLCPSKAERKSGGSDVSLPTPPYALILTFIAFLSKPASLTNTTSGHIIT